MGSIDQNNSFVFPLDEGQTFNGIYSSTTNFSEIVISIETDTKFEFVVQFSSNGIDLGLTETYTQNTITNTANIYQFKPYLRYFRVILNNIDVIDQTYLRLETILKSNVIYDDTSNTPSTNVNIQNPLNSNGYVQMVNMLNNYENGNLLVSGVVSGNVDSVIVSPLSFDGNSVNVSITNPSITVSNTILDNMIFSNSALVVNDLTANAFLNTINNNLNTRGTNFFYDAPILANTNTPSINLSQIPIKLISLYGRSSSTTTLTLVFSSDNINFYKTQYSILVNENTDFGFSIPANPSYLSINSSNAVSDKLTIFMDYS
jgi:hypothetical protein